MLLHTRRRRLLAVLLGLFGSGVWAQPAHRPGATAASDGSPPVVVSGTVPDEATKAAVLLRLRELYGSDRVSDQISIGSVVAPPNWNAYLQKLLAPNIQQVHRGQLSVDGNNISIAGQVANEALRQQVASEMALALNPTYTINNRLFVGGGDQSALDTVLANRIVEFESGSATLTSAGKAVLDDMAVALLKLAGKKVEVIGNTDGSGNRASNLALSQSRANAVREYLVAKGLPEANLSTLGVGPDRPVSSNESPEGRARNRRIEFRVLP